MKCFYHRSDFDGQCSGILIKNKYSICELIGINYSDAVPWDIINPNEIVFMVDFSLPLEEMKRLKNSCNQLIWIDHHDTAINELKELELEGIQRNGIGACALVWEFLYPGRKPPIGVKLLAEYDVWNHTNPKTLPFQAGLWLENTSVENTMLWQKVITSDPHWIWYICYRGRIAIEKNEKDNRSYINAFSFECEFEGYKARAVNRGLCNSKIFDSLEEDYDILITFVLSKNREWRFSIYTNKEHIHCGEIAKKYGGGGHKAAAGFSLSYLPKEFFN